MLPPQLLNLRHRATGQHPKADRHHRRAGLGAVRQGLVEHLPEPRELLGALKPLAPLLLVAFDVQTRVRAVGAPAPYFRQGEHLGEHAEGPIGLVRRFPQGVMQLGDVAALTRRPDCCEGVPRRPSRSRSCTPRYPSSAPNILTPTSSTILKSVNICR